MLGFRFCAAVGALVFVHSGCEMETSTTTLALSDDDEVEVEGEDVSLVAFAGAPGVTELYNFDAEAEDGEVEGSFRVRDFLNGVEFADVSGTVDCVTVQADGITARLGGTITASLFNGQTGVFDGTFGIWTVVDNGDSDSDSDEDGANPDQATDLLFGIANVAVRDFHCATGFPTTVFNTFEETAGDIEVETD